MAMSVFPSNTGLSRDTPWEEHLFAHTPVEERQGLWYKREDYFAPLGYGNINGSKLRQLIWLLKNYRDAGGDKGVITGASVLSPQVSMGALTAAHFGLPITVVLGGTKPATAIKHENVAIANSVGARFVYNPVGYNPALQKAVERLHDTTEYEGWFRLHYGITTGPNETVQGVEAFHRVGAEQAFNIPDHITTIGIPAGSCISVSSVLYGLALARPKALKKVVLFGIGPTRLEFIQARLGQIEAASGVPIRSLFTHKYAQHPDLEAQHQRNGPITLEHHDLHTTKFSDYQMKMPWSEDGISFHPTYEGKMMTYLNRYPDKFPWYHERKGDSLLWIIGSTPRRAA